MLGFVFRYPQYLRRRESGHRQIACDPVQRRRSALQLTALFIAARVVPENGRAKNSVGAIEQYGSMHLTGEPKAAHRGQGCRTDLPKLIDRVQGSLPPVFRGL